MNQVNKLRNHDEMIPLKFYLSQNYPNPFKEKTRIKYCTAFKTNVILSVFNSNKKLLRKIVDKEHEPGTYEIEFVANDLSKGIYFYQIQAGEYFNTKKMILLK